MGIGQTEELVLRGCGLHKVFDIYSRIVLGKQTEEGESPVDEIYIKPAESRVPRDTRNPVGSRGDHPPSLNTP